MTDQPRKRGDEAAFPVVAENGLGHIADGLTIREYAAIQLIKSYAPVEDDDLVVRLVLERVDCLLAELGKKG